MHIFLIILAIVLWLASAVTLFYHQSAAPLLSFLGLTTISQARIDGLQLLPVNTVMLIGWFAITLVVTIATMLQPAAIREQKRGVGYMLGGGFTGLVLGLLAATITSTPSLVYGIMIVTVAVAVFFGFLIFTNTPRGIQVGIPTGRFFRYLLAKGFPVAVSLMMPGMVLVLMAIKSQVNSL